MRTPGRHQYDNYKPQSWDFIENRFKEDWGDQFLSLIELVKHIKSSGLSNRLYGTTSMAKLIVSNNHKLDFRKEALHVSFDLSSKKWHFQYFSKPDTKAEFSRIYDADKGIQKFNNFIELIKW